MKNTTKHKRLSTVPVLEEVLASVGSQNLPTIWWSEQSQRDQGRTFSMSSRELYEALIAAYLQIRSLEAKVAALQGFVNAK